MNDDEKYAVVYEAEGESINLTPAGVQKFIVGDDNGKITLKEFYQFAQLCKVRKLNPFLREAYCIKYGNQPATIVVGKDAILKKAVNHPDYDGMESGIIVQCKETGKITEREGVFYIPEEENLVGGWAKVYRKNVSHPRYMSVPYCEVVQRKKDGSINTMWSTKAATMLEKVAKTRALREAFIEDLGGMYDSNDPDPDDKPIPPVIDVTPQEETISQNEPNGQEEQLSLADF